MRVRVPSILLVLAAAGLTLGFLVLVAQRRMPLGVPGEWEWLRVPFGPSALDLRLAAVGVVGYAAFAGLGMGWLARRATPAREALAVGGLVVAAVAGQAVVQSGAPTGYGLAKWAIALHSPASSGYFQVARTEARAVRPFLARYPAWVERGDSLHLGTHPPGLIVVEALLLQWFEAQPAVAEMVEALAPESVLAALRVVGQNDPLSQADRATLILTGALTLLASAATVVPLYRLARRWFAAPVAWSIAALWPLAPAAVLFQPAADTAFPLLAALILSLATSRAQVRGGTAIAVGVLLALGMQFSLVFLAVGLVTGLVVGTDTNRPPGRRLVILLGIGAGFLAATALVGGISGSNPLVIWWWNARNHARFYADYHRTYGRWLVVNPIETAVAIGLPATCLLVAASVHPQRWPRVSVATVLVLVLLTVSGRNLSEVARLWLPFQPLLLLAGGRTLERTGAGAGKVALLVAWTGLGTLALQAMIQVVYPI